jgi:hypothetical protein
MLGWIGEGVNRLSVSSKPLILGQFPVADLVANIEILLDTPHRQAEAAVKTFLDRAETDRMRTILVFNQLVQLLPSIGQVFLKFLDGLPHNVGNGGGFGEFRNCGFEEFGHQRRTDDFADTPFHAPAQARTARGIWS